MSAIRPKKSARVKSPSGAARSPVRGLEPARRATVRVCDRAGTHVGQGLLLHLSNEGAVVLTCHHVIAHLPPEELCVAIPQADGTLGSPVPATYDAARSRPARDAVVLRLDGVSPSEMPLLHALNASAYDGSLPEKAICLSHFKTDSFDGWVSAATRVEVPVQVPGPWPNAPIKYVLPSVFRLSEPSDAREGISGSVVVYEGGVLGLANFSRPAGHSQEREVYVVPLAEWADAWPALASLIEPLVDERLRSAAIVRRAAALRVPDDVAIAGYRPEVNLERPITDRARAAIEKHGGVVIIGRPKSGKTRVAWQLLQDRPDAIAVIPYVALPPASFDTSTLMGTEVVLFFDDLHRFVLTNDPVAWHRRLEEASGGSCVVICTSRDGEDWKTVERSGASRLIDALGRDALVFASRFDGEGDDLSEAEGLQLAKALGLNRQQFEQRFDGTPGSLALDLADMRQRYLRLRDEQRGGVAMSRLVDAAKLVYEASQTRLRGPVLRSAAERIRGDARMSGETWEALQRRTTEEGFGVFQADTGDFQTYKPYLEACVAYRPSVEEIKALVPVLVELKDYDGLTSIGQALFMRHHEYAAAEEALRAAIEGGKDDVIVMLAMLLGSVPGREAETEELHRRSIAAGDIGSCVNLGSFLSRQPGREADAEAAFREAIAKGAGTSTATIASWSLGNFLLRIPGREREAEAALKNAKNAGFFMAYLPLARILASDPKRLKEAEEVAREAFAAIERQRESIEPSHAKSPAEHQDLFDSTRGELFDLLGRILDQQPGREAEAEEAYRSAIAAGFDSHWALGVLLARQGQSVEAEAMLRTAIANGETRAQFHLGVLLGQEGRAAESEDAFRKAVDAGVPQAYEALGDLLATQPDRVADAEQAYRSAIASGVDTVHFSLGELLFREPERIMEAEHHYREAAALADVRAAYRLGHILTSRVMGGAPELADDAERNLRTAVDAGIDAAALSLGFLLAAQPARADEGIAMLKRARDAGVDGADDILRSMEDTLSRAQSPRRKRRKSQPRGHPPAP
jgi:tetratricopeptide (TPR) repeat protein